MGLEKVKVEIDNGDLSPLEVGLDEDLSISVCQLHKSIHIDPKKVRDFMDALVLTLRAGSMVYRRREEVKHERNNQRNHDQVPEARRSRRD